MGSNVIVGVITAVGEAEGVAGAGVGLQAAAMRMTAIAGRMIF